MVHLLKSGIPWDAIMLMSEQETYFVLGVLSALQQREQDAEAKAAAPAASGLGSL